MKLLIEGKAKKIFSTKDKNTLVQYFKDDATAFNNKKRKLFKSKGVLNNCISALIFEYLKINTLKSLEEMFFLRRSQTDARICMRVSVCAQKPYGTFPFISL